MATLSGFIYRKQLTITGTSAGVQTSYPEKLTIYLNSGTDAAKTVYLNGHSYNWPNDIRFTTSDGTTLLDYWIESYSGDKAYVWVELDSIPASPSTVTFYMYYGSTSATSLSNITNTFALFGDDLEGDTIGNDPSKWTITQGTNSLIKVNGDLLYRRIGETIPLNLAAMYFAPDGRLWAGHQTDGTVLVSEDGGVSWTTKYTFSVGSDRIRCIFVAQNGYIYASRENSQILVYSIDGGDNWSTCLTLSNAVSVVWHMDEDISTGYLYVGEYSTGDGSELCSYIYKSINNATSWTTIWNNPDSSRHIHIVKVDPYTGYLYASQDDTDTIANRKLIRSIDGGENWTTLGSGSSLWMITSVAFGSGYRLFGTDAPAGGAAIRKTTNDSSFTDVYTPPSTDDTAFWNGGHIRSDGLIIFGSWTQADNERATIIASMDAGVTWTVVEEMVTGVGNRGYNFLSNFDIYGNIIISRSISSDCEKIYYSNTLKVIKCSSADTTQGSGYVNVTFPTFFAIEHEVSFGQEDSVLSAVYLQQDTTLRITVAGWSDRLIYYHNGTTWVSTGVSYLKNKVYRLRYTVRMNTQRWDLFIDEVSVASSIPFRVAGSTVNRLYALTGAAVQGLNYADNVRVRQYANPAPTFTSWDNPEIIAPTVLINGVYKPVLNTFIRMAAGYKKVESIYIKLISGWKKVIS